MKIPLIMLFGVISWNISGTTADKVLFVPYQHYSHFNALALMGTALAEDGHDVWILTLDELKTALPKNGAVNPLIFSVSQEAESKSRIKELMRLRPTGDGVMEQVLRDKFQSFGIFCDEVMQNVELMKTIEDIEFNIVIMDAVLEYSCMYMVPYRFGIPYITFSNGQLASWYAGVTGLPSIEPEQRTVFSNRMSFFQRLENLHLWLALERDPFLEAFSESHMKKYAPHRPQVTYYELLRQSEMFLINHEIMCLDYPRVTAPNYQFLGVTSSESAEPLSGDLKNFVEDAEHGIVVMSLGSHKAYQMTWQILRNKTFKALGKLPQRAIVQYGFEKTGDIASNIKLVKWLPQNDLLGHPQTRLFITHGGNNGQNEAAYHGVPSLVIPLTFDQPYSGVRVETHGYGKYVKDKQAVTSEELFEMMSDIINNASYSTNIKRCSKIIRSMPKSKERFVFWVNHILSFGGAHLKPPSLEMPLYKLFMLDIAAFYIALVVVSSHVMLIGLAILYQKYFKIDHKKKSI